MTNSIRNLLAFIVSSWLDASWTMKKKLLKEKPFSASFFPGLKNKTQWVSIGNFKYSLLSLCHHWSEIGDFFHKKYHCIYYIIKYFFVLQSFIDIAVITLCCLLFCWQYCSLLYTLSRITTLYSDNQSS